MTVAGRQNRGHRIASTAGFVLASAVSAGLCGVIIGRIARALSGNRMAPWILGRASGVTSYVLLVLLVLVGLGLSRPARPGRPRRLTAVRIRLHIALAALLLVFTAVHVVVLATDRYAGVGLWGAVLPMGASYRPVATTLGVAGLWTGLLFGATAGLAGRIPVRAWWWLHKVAAVSLVLLWLHGWFGGRDTATLRWMYLVSAGAVVTAMVVRYLPSRRRAVARIGEAL